MKKAVSIGIGHDNKIDARQKRFDRMFKRLVKQNAKAKKERAKKGKKC